MRTYLSLIILLYSSTIFASSAPPASVAPVIQTQIVIISNIVSNEPADLLKAAQERESKADEKLNQVLAALDTSVASTGNNVNIIIWVFGIIITLILGFNIYRSIESDNKIRQLTSEYEVRLQEFRSRGDLTIQKVENKTDEVLKTTGDKTEKALEILRKEMDSLRPSFSDPTQVATPEDKQRATEYLKVSNEYEEKKAQLSAEDYYDRGYAYYNLKQYDKAIVNYSEAIKLDPDNSTYKQGRAFAYDYLGQNETIVSKKLLYFEQAIQDYSKYIEIAPHLQYCFDIRAYIYDRIAEVIKADNPEEAAKYKKLAEEDRKRDALEKDKEIKRVEDFLNGQSQ